MVAEASKWIFKLEENTWGGLLHRNHQHEPGMPGQEHDPDTPDQLRRHYNVISADESEMIKIQKLTMDWTGELAELFGQANTEGIHTAIQGLRTKYN
jgi:hypothetical protein